MRRILVLLVALSLCGCGDQEPPITAGYVSWSGIVRTHHAYVGRCWTTEVYAVVIERRVGDGVRRRRLEVTTAEHSRIKEGDWIDLAELAASEAPDPRKPAAENPVATDGAAP